MLTLIVEDNLDHALSLQTLVSFWGYQSVIVHDGAAALKMMRSPDGPGLVLLDWELPGMDGLEVCRQVRETITDRYIYVLLVTGRDGLEDRVAGLEAGADEFLTKPVDALELRARLNAGKRILSLQEQLLTAQKRLEEQATRDALTGIWNRGAILEILDRELARVSREGGSLGILLADVDHFKQVNDTHGHLAGDRVLREVAQRLQVVLRTYDAVGRYGGEEFLVVLPGCDTATILHLAERLRQSIADRPVEQDGFSVPITLSLGAATWKEGASSAGLIRSADDALYRAKSSGRNRSELTWSDPARQTVERSDARHDIPLFLSDTADRLSRPASLLVDPVEGTEGNQVNPMEETEPAPRSFIFKIPLCAPLTSEAIEPPCRLDGPDSP
jgi:diguanylate cyclase (GGDEF)-like protein